MYRYKVLVVSVLLVILLFASTAAVFAKSGPFVYSPDAKVQGKTYVEWSGVWWQTAISIPADVNPVYGGTGLNCEVVMSRHVGILLGNTSGVSGVQRCSAPAGTTILVPLVNVECSTVEAPPFYGGNKQELRDCLSHFSFSDLNASIDGVAVPNLEDYIFQSPMYKIQVPANNILGVAGPTTGYSMGAGGYLLIGGLRPGEHTLSVGGTIPEFPYTVSMDFKITIQHDD